MASYPFWFTPELERRLLTSAHADDIRDYNVRFFSDGRVNVNLTADFDFGENEYSLDLTLDVRDVTFARDVWNWSAPNLAVGRMVLGRARELITRHFRSAQIDPAEPTLQNCEDAQTANVMPPDASWTLKFTASPHESMLELLTCETFDAWEESCRIDNGNPPDEVRRMIAEAQICAVLYRPVCRRFELEWAPLRAACDRAVREYEDLRSADHQLAGILRRRCGLGQLDSAGWLLPDATIDTVSDERIDDLLNY